jgi:hypothetical protein
MDKLFAQWGNLTHKAPRIPRLFESRAIYQNIVWRGWPLLIESVLLNFSTCFDIIMVGILGAYTVAAVGLRISPKGFKVIGEASNGEEAWNVI